MNFANTQYSSQLSQTTITNKIIAPRWCMCSDPGTCDMFLEVDEVADRKKVVKQFTL